MWEIIIWIFAIYGVLKLMQDIVELIEVKRILNGEIEVVLKVFNKQDEVEDIVLKLLKDIPKAIIKIEDAGSYDDTYTILTKLEKENKNLYVMRM